MIIVLSIDSHEDNRVERSLFYSTKEEVTIEMDDCIVSNQEVSITKMKSDSDTDNGTNATKVAYSSYTAPQSEFDDLEDAFETLDDEELAALDVDNIVVCQRPIDDIAPYNDAASESLTKRHASCLEVDCCVRKPRKRHKPRKQLVCPPTPSDDVSDDDHG